MSLSCVFSVRFACAGAVLLAACVRAGPSRSSVAVPAPAAPSIGGQSQVEMLLDAELGVSSCAPGTEHNGIAGFARIKVRDALEWGSTGELEYELFVENERRLTLGGASLEMAGIAAPVGSASVQTIVLWAGETSNKQRLRMRGIVALPKGASTAEFAAALRERRSALQVRISDQSGSPAGCGDLRN